MSVGNVAGIHPFGWYAISFCCTLFIYVLWALIFHFTRRYRGKGVPQAAHLLRVNQSLDQAPDARVPPVRSAMPGEEVEADMEAGRYSHRYSGSFSHPKFGSNNFSIEVSLDDSGKGKWKTLGQTEDITMVRKGKHIMIEEKSGVTKFDGYEDAGGVIEGKVIQWGQPGGGFRLQRRNSPQAGDDVAKGAAVTSAVQVRVQPPENDAVSQQVGSAPPSVLRRNETDASNPADSEQPGVRNSLSLPAALHKDGWAQPVSPATSFPKVPSIPPRPSPSPPPSPRAEIKLPGSVSSASLNAELDARLLQPLPDRGSTPAGGGEDSLRQYTLNDMASWSAAPTSPTTAAKDLAVSAAEVEFDAESDMAASAADDQESSASELSEV